MSTNVLFFKMLNFVILKGIAEEKYGGKVFTMVSPTRVGAGSPKVMNSSGSSPVGQTKQFTCREQESLGSGVHKVWSKSVGSSPVGSFAA
jgi:hypothetical protein